MGLKVAHLSSSTPFYPERKRKNATTRPDEVVANFSEIYLMHSAGAERCGSQRFQLDLTRRL